MHFIKLQRGYNHIFSSWVEPRLNSSDGISHETGARERKLRKKKPEMENKWNKRGEEETKEVVRGRVNRKKQDGVSKLKISESPTCVFLRYVCRG